MYKVKVAICKKCGCSYTDSRIGADGRVKFKCTGCKTEGCSDKFIVGVLHYKGVGA